MSCPITLLGIDVDCATIGGIKEVYIADYNDIEDVEMTANVIDSIDLASGKYFRKYKLRKQTGGFESTLNADDQAGTVFYETNLELTFPNMTTAKRVELQALALGQLVAIVKDANDKYWYLGYDNPVTLTGGGGSTGTAYGDANQYTATLTDMGKFLPIEVADTIIDALFEAE